MSVRLARSENGSFKVRVRHLGAPVSGIHAAARCATRRDTQHQQFSNPRPDQLSIHSTRAERLGDLLRDERQRCGSSVIVEIGICATEQSKKKVSPPLFPSKRRWWIRLVGRRHRSVGPTCASTRLSRGFFHTSVCSKMTLNGYALLRGSKLIPRAATIAPLYGGTMVFVFAYSISIIWFQGGKQHVGLPEDSCRAAAAAYISLKTCHFRAPLVM